MKTGRPKLKYCKYGHLLENTRGRYPSGKTYCKQCRKAYTSRSRKEDPLRWKNYELKRNYGITLDQLDDHCAICGATDDLNADHDHRGDGYRGTLCGRCNRALGLLRDQIPLFLNAIKYLEGVKAA